MDGEIVALDDSGRPSFRAYAASTIPGNRRGETDAFNHTFALKMQSLNGQVLS